jgi:DNA polymerase-3 subunit delta'
VRIDQIRDLQHELALSPVEGRYRVAILSRFETANANAANALLKTLEEPPERVILILTASEADVLLPTIVSRCQVLSLRPLSLEDMRAALLARGLSAEHADHLAHLSGGRLGWALRAVGDGELLARRNHHLDELRRLLDASRTARFNHAEDLARDGATLREALDVWLSWWRDLLLVTTNARIPLTNVDRADELHSLASAFTSAQAQQAVVALRDATWHLDRNANPRLLTEVLLLDLPRR